MSSRIKGDVLQRVGSQQVTKYNHNHTHEYTNTKTHESVYTKYALFNCSTYTGSVEAAGSRPEEANLRPAHTPQLKLGEVVLISEICYLASDV